MCPHPGAGLCFCPATASTQHPSSHSAPALHPRRRSRPETESLTQTYLSCKEFTGSLTEQPREGQLSAPGGRHPLSRFLPRLTHVVTLKRPGPPHTHRPSPASNALLSAPPQTNHTQLSGRGQHGVHSQRSGKCTALGTHPSGHSVPRPSTTSRRGVIPHHLTFVSACCDCALFTDKETGSDQSTCLRPPSSEAGDPGLKQTG